MNEIGRHSSPKGLVRALKGPRGYRLEILGDIYNLMESSALVHAIEDAQRDIENDSAREWGRQ